MMVDFDGDGGIVVSADIFSQQKLVCSENAIWGRF
jgi:hypothetical protein